MSALSTTPFWTSAFVDLAPDVVLLCAEQADSDGNLYTGPNTEDTPAIVEATAFKNGIVIAQVNEVVDKLPRVDIPADWVVTERGVYRRDTDKLVFLGLPLAGEPSKFASPVCYADEIAPDFFGKK